MNWKWKIYPALILLLLFVVDLPANFESIRNSGRPEATEAEVSTRYAKRIFARLAEEQKTSKNKHVLLLGSSRTMFFGELTEDRIKRDPALTAEQKAKLLNHTLQTEVSFPGVDLLIQLMIMDELAKSNYKPDLIVIEIAPEFFNERYIESQYDKNMFDAAFLRRHMDAFPREMKLDAIFRVLFPSYAYRFKPDQAIANGFESDFDLKWELASTVIQSRQSFGSHGKDVIDFAPTDKIPPEIYERRFSGLATHLREGLVQGLTFNRNLQKLFQRIVSLSGSTKMILWRPATSELFAKEIYEASGIKANFMDTYNQIIAESGRPYYDANELLPRCNRWEDVSHLSRKCYGLLTQAILDRAKK